MNAETLDTTDDPFERAVKREGMLRRVGLTQRDAMRIIRLWFAVLLGVWAAILAGHWLAFPEPRWLAVLHTVVFAVSAAFMLVAMAFQAFILRRLGPDGDL